MRLAFLGRMSRVAVALVPACTFGAGAAFADGQGLASAGPTDPANGFPTFYQDKTGRALEQCLVVDPLDSCGLVGAGAVPDPTQPIVFPTNFPEEFFYWTANARIKPLAGNKSFRADLTVGLEGAFGNNAGTVVDGDQVVFARFRFRVNGGLVPGATYTVTYPFGVKTFVASATGTINFTDDQGCTATPPACDFASVLTTTNAGPFLAWDATAPAPPAGFIGDPNVDHAITGSPFGTNFLRIDGPNVGGPGVNTLQQNLFQVTGKLFDGVLQSALLIDRTSYSRTATGMEVNLLVHAAKNGAVTAGAVGFPNTTLTRDAVSGRYVARVNRADPAAVKPAFIRYTSTSPKSAATVRDAPLVDEVTVTSATYSLSSHLLTVNAVSSDQVAPPTLVAAGSVNEPLGALTNGFLSVSLVAPPYQVNVTSSAGGKRGLRVDLIP